MDELRRELAMLRLRVAAGENGERLQATIAELTQIRTQHAATIEQQKNQLQQKQEYIELINQRLAQQVQSNQDLEQSNRDMEEHMMLEDDILKKKLQKLEEEKNQVDTQLANFKTTERARAEHIQKVNMTNSQLTNKLQEREKADQEAKLKFADASKRIQELEKKLDEMHQAAAADTKKRKCDEYEIQQTKAENHRLEQKLKEMQCPESSTLQMCKVTDTIFPTPLSFVSKFVYLPDVSSALTRQMIADELENDHFGTVFLQHMLPLHKKLQSVFCLAQINFDICKAEQTHRNDNFLLIVPFSNYLRYNQKDACDLFRLSMSDSSSEIDGLIREIQNTVFSLK